METESLRGVTSGMDILRRLTARALLILLPLMLVSTQAAAARRAPIAAQNGHPHACATASPTAPREREILAMLLDLTNRERAHHGLAPVRLQANLSEAARWMALDMAAYGYVSHTDHRGRSIDPRLPAFGYGDYSSIGENIGAGQQTAEDVFTGWMHSPEHRRNILNPEFREIGIAHVFCKFSSYGHYWIQDFGVRTSDESQVAL